MTAQTARGSVLVNGSPQKVWEAAFDPVALKRYFMGTTVKTDQIHQAASLRPIGADHEKNWPTMLEGLKTTVDA